MDRPLPVTAFMSVALHAGALAGWIYMNQMAKQNNLKIISNVELMIQVQKPRAVAVRSVRAPTPPSTWNFLKMALPNMPHVQAPMQVRAPVEEAKRNLMDVKRLQDRGRMKKMGPMEALDMNRRHASLAQLDAKLDERSSHAALAQAPKLEDIGMRRAPKAVIDMAESLEAERRGRLQGMDVPSAIDSHHPSHALPAQPMLPEEAAPTAPAGGLRKFAEMLTNDSSMEPARPMAIAPRVEMQAPPVERKSQELLSGKKKKSVEIEGPLSHRKVTYYELPKFPSWAAAQGILEAEVLILFYVTPSGDVLPNMRVDQTSGYSALDRLAMDALKNWRFQAIPDGTGNQWGRITFRFVLE